MIGRVGGPHRLLDLDSRHFLALIEGVVRESPPHAAALDGLYTSSRKTPAPADAPAVSDRSERNRDIQRIQRIFG